jgi:transposase
MNHESLFLFKIQDKAHNSEDYAEFLNKLIEYLNCEGIEGAYLIMDNVRFHKTELVRNLIQSHGHNAVFLPPYSPFLNPIENMFNQWKSLIKRSEPKTVDQLYELVHNTSQLITQQNCADYVENMERYIIRCLNREEIEN